MDCAGCHLEIVAKDGYGSFTYGRGDTTLEKLQSYKVARYCAACSRALRADLGLPEPAEIPDPPISCHDSRVSLVP